MFPSSGCALKPGQASCRYGPRYVRMPRDMRRDHIYRCQVMGRAHNRYTWVAAPTAGTVPSRPGSARSLVNRLRGREEIAPRIEPRLRWAETSPGYDRESGFLAKPATMQRRTERRVPPLRPETRYRR